MGAGATLPLVGTGAASASGVQQSGGDDAHWTTGEQYGVGTVADHGDDDASRVWFTLTEGALTGGRFPRIDLMNLRTLEFVVADPDAGYAVRTFNESRRDDESTVERTTEMAADDALVFEQTITDAERGWTLEVEYAADPDRDALLADVRFTAEGRHRYDVYVVADTALSNSGTGDAGTVRGTPGDRHLTARDTGVNDDAAVILDEDGTAYDVAAALASDRGFEAASADVVGGDVEALYEDGSFASNDTAEGNVALVGRLASDAARIRDTVALGFAEAGDERAAADEAAGALSRAFASVRREYAKGWREYLKTVETPESVRGDPELRRQYDAAAMVLKAVESKRFPGAGVASPSVPWGEAVEANDPSDYGYNYVWARDLYQSYTALDAMGDGESARAALEYLYSYQQREDGFFPQNTFLDGRTRWGGEQMDNVSFPQVMAYQLEERHDVGFAEADYGYGNVRRSADYVVANGPATGQERWEEESGYSPSTTAAEIAGLACAARLAADEDERGDALVYLALADEWQSRTEEWMATTEGTDDHAQTPYYFRINDDRDPDDGATRDLANGGPALDERDVIDAGFLELVRLGVKPWDDEVVRNSLSVVDDTIRVETPHGPAFYRYNGDGYGEQDGSDNPAGAPWSLDYSGQGRLWPIFTGERGEYELLASTDSGPETPRDLLRTMAGFANSGRMLPEQVWDRPESTEYGWEFGSGTGSATPLAWSMAQFVRLAHSIDAGEPVERPAFVAERYTDGSRPEGPSLDVEFPPTVVSDAQVTVSGTTDGAEVVVKTPAETVRRSVGGDGQFSIELTVGDGETDITVVAATAGDVTEVGTAVARKTVAHVDVGDPLAEFDDPEGDDRGPGSYVYPEADVFVDGAFDVDSFGVFETDDAYQFLVRLGELTNPWGGTAMSVQTLQIYVRDPDAAGGTTEARKGVNATFEAPYHYRVFAEGFEPARVEAADGSEVTRDVSRSGYQTVDAIKLEVPKSAFGGDLAGKQLVPLMLGQDGWGPGRIRRVEAEASDWTFGGGRDDSMDPNVIDLVTPDGVSQSEALDYSATERATIPYLSLD